MGRKTNDILDEQRLDEEIADLEKQLAAYAILQQRRSQLLEIKRLAAAAGLWGNRPKSSGNGHSPMPSPKTRRVKTTADLLSAILAEKGPLSNADVLAEARGRGYEGSGNDSVDKKRLLAALYMTKTLFHRLEDGKWELKQ
jgi:hypothetical protein